VEHFSQTCQGWISVQVFETASDKPDVVPLSEQGVEAGPSRPEILKQTALRSLGELPPFSPILNRLMASLAAEDVSFAKLGDLIEKDTVLAGNVLHLVNSALYARRGTINSVRHALSLLGVTKLRNAVLGMSITRMWNQVQTPPSWSMARFDLHSAATAILSDLLAQRLPVSYPEGAFVAGLLHDVGRLLIALSLGADHDRILQVHEETGQPYLDCEQTILGFTHPELSSEALAFWNLPEPIRTAVRHHHTPEADPSEIEPRGIALSRVIDSANQYVNSQGVCILAKHGTDAMDSSLVESLGLDRSPLEALLADFKAEYDAMAQFFR
jgi:HD-like signal output (HDOD) protein